MQEKLEKESFTIKEQRKWSENAGEIRKKNLSGKRCPISDFRAEIFSSS